MILATGLLALPIAACGSTQSSSATGASASPASGAQTLRVDADPNGALKFTTDELTAKAGKVTIRMTNPSSISHSIALEGRGVDEESPRTSVTIGKTATVTATLKRGTYTFYCPVDGHRQAGMEGTLTVS